MCSGHIQGQVLKMICKMIKPESILELGTFTGYSAICMAEALPDNGVLHTIDINDELEEFTKSYFEKSGQNQKICYHIGDAKNIIPTINEQFDMVFIDAEKSEYIEYYNLCFDKVKNGGFILADNILWSGKVIKNDLRNNDHFTKGIIAFNDYVQNDERVENVIFPFRDGLMIIRKK